MDATQALIEAYREEIQFLRCQNKELVERVASFSGQAYQAYLTRDLAKFEAPVPSYIDDITGQIVKMDASTKEEEEEKKAALDQVGQLLGA
jgi:hypothetical protein